MENNNFKFELKNWEVGPSDDSPSSPDEWVSASVPGAVQLDWARAHDWPDYSWDCEATRYIGLEDRFWHYRADLPEFPEGTACRLVLRDVDHHAVVCSGGRVLAEGGGIGQDLSVDLEAELSGQPIEIILSPAPKVPDTLGRDRARETTKAPVSYGWDFHPDLIPLGITGGAWVEALAPNHLRGVCWRDRLADDFSRADFEVRAEVVGSGRVRACLADPDGKEVWSDSVEAEAAGSIRLCGAVDAPRLWWPRGHGAPERYTLRLELESEASASGSGSMIERKVGFRRSRLTMAPGQWDEPEAFPKSRSLPPMSLEVNGRRIFAKGANLVGPDIFPGTVDDARWHQLVARAVEANMNVIRVWGGSAAPKEAFFEACDAAGIMVVQEFPLACNAYPDKKDYLEELADAARALLERLAFHPSRILWSGGNELFNAWSGMTDQSHALRLIAAMAWQEDPDTPFVPTLPVEGVGHGYYLFRDPQSGVEVFELFQSARNTGYTEFGVPGTTSEAGIHAIVPAEELWPPRTVGAWKLHSGMEAWDVEPTSYLCMSTIEHYWGPQPDLAALIEKSQWLQCEGHKAIIEEGRRQRPFCGWAVLWCLNEPWPTVANQALLAYPDTPKPAFEAVAAAMRPTLASARIPKFQWCAGEMFTAELHLLHDAPEPRPAVSVRVSLRAGAWSKTLLQWEAEAGPADCDLAGPTVRFVLPTDLECGELWLHLEADDDALSSCYRLALMAVQDATEEDAHRPRGLNT